MKITKKLIKSYVRGKLGSDPTWASKALLKIFEFQTASEQSLETTSEANGIGFTGVDGEFLTSLAKQLKYRGKLSDKQMVYVLKKMPKYWNQILGITDYSRLFECMKAEGVIDQPAIQAYKKAKFVEIL